MARTKIAQDLKFIEYIRIDVDMISRAIEVPFCEAFIDFVSKTGREERISQPGAIARNVWGLCEYIL